jgi:hypothetical protein
MNPRLAVHRSIFLVVLLLAAGCATKTPEPAEISAQEDAKCQSYGLTPGTPEYEKCRTKLADLRAQQEYKDRAALAGRLQGRMPQ